LRKRGEIVPGAGDEGVEAVLCKRDVAPRAVFIDIMRDEKSNAVPATLSWLLPPRLTGFCLVLRRHPKGEPLTRAQRPRAIHAKGESKVKCLDGGGFGTQWR
jgi:hypothetical protein